MKWIVRLFSSELMNVLQRQADPRSAWPERIFAGEDANTVKFSSRVESDASLPSTMQSDNEGQVQCWRIIFLQREKDGRHRQ